MQEKHHILYLCAYCSNSNKRHPTLKSFYIKKKIFFNFFIKIKDSVQHTKGQLKQNRSEIQNKRKHI